MPFLKPKYDSQSDIPEAFRDYYVQKGSVWELAQENDEIAVHFNSGLAANRDTLKRERDDYKQKFETADARRKVLETDKPEEQQREIKRITEEKDAVITSQRDQITTLKAKAETNVLPDDQVAVPKAKAKALEEYEKLGTPKDLQKKIVEELPTLQATVDRYSKDSELRRIADNVLGWNFDPLRMLLTHPDNAGMKLITKKVKVKDDKGVETEEEQAFLVMKEDGKDVEHPLTDYAEAHWAPHMPALTAEVEATNGDRSTQQTSTQKTETGKQFVQQRRSATGTKGKSGLDAKKIAEEFNTRRDTIDNPLAPKPPPKTGAGAGA
jgi:hypothetical protein